MAIKSIASAPLADVTAGAVDLNMYEVAAVASGSMIALNGLALLATVAPAYVGVVGSVAGGTAYVGYRKRNDLPLNPFTKTEEDGTVEIAIN